MILSDDEDVIQQTPKKIKTQRKGNTIRFLVLSSDSEDDKEKKHKSPKKTKIAAERLKPVNIDEVFSNKPVKQSKVDPLPKTKPVEIGTSSTKKKSKKKKSNPELDTHKDEDFEKTLLDLDDDLLLENADFLDKTIEEALQRNEQHHFDFDLKDFKQDSSSEKVPEKNKENSSNKNFSNDDSNKQNKKRPRKNSQGMLGYSV